MKCGARHRSLHRDDDRQTVQKLWTILDTRRLQLLQQLLLFPARREVVARLTGSLNVIACQRISHDISGYVAETRT
jgi:hypothetical protein